MKIFLCWTRTRQTVLWRIENYRQFLDNRRAVLAQTVNDFIASVMTNHKSRNAE